MAYENTGNTDGAKSGQFPVVKTMNPNINSSTAGGQAPVKSTTEGVRDGNWTGRGCVSPLGGATMGETSGNQQKEERKERP